MKKMLHILPVLLLLCTMQLQAQHCNLVKQTVVRHNSEDERLGAQRNSVTTYHYDTYHRPDSMVNELGQVYTWYYAGDTVIEKTTTSNAQTTTTYIPDSRGLCIQQEVVTVYQNDSSGRLVPSPDTTVSNYIYAPEGTLLEIITLSNRSYNNSRCKLTWSNGNKVAEEYTDIRNKLQQRQVYEYYDDQAFKQLYPNEAAMVPHSHNMIKRSVLEIYGRQVMAIEFTYEYNAQGQVTRMTSATTNNGHKSYTTFVYDCR